VANASMIFDVAEPNPSDARFEAVLPWRLHLEPAFSEPRACDIDTPWRSTVRSKSLIRRIFDR